MVQIVAGQLSWEPAVSNVDIKSWNGQRSLESRNWGKLFLHYLFVPIKLSSEPERDLTQDKVSRHLNLTIDKQIWLKWAWVRSTSRKKCSPSYSSEPRLQEKKLFPLFEIWNWSHGEKAIIGCHQSDSKWIFRPGDQGCVRGIVKKREGRKCLRGRKAFSSWPALDWRRRGPLGICLLHQVDLQGFTFFLEADYGVYDLNKQHIALSISWIV